ncbi:MAG: L,D-transpeptidase [Anaerolineae bacterium]
MSFPKILLIISVGLFALIGAAAVIKKTTQKEAMPIYSATVQKSQASVFQKRDVKKERNEKIKEELVPLKAVSVENSSAKIEKTPSLANDQKAFSAMSDESGFPNVDRIHRLFTTGPNKLPIVETITYSTNVPWLKGRPAWIADYASFYSTSRHFIARSLNGKPDYFSQKISPGSRFNVFRKDKDIQFYLLVDLSRCKMAFYYIDMATNERTLLKTYRVGLGRLDENNASKSSTPTGKYKLGSKVAIYKPGIMGLYKDQPTEMIQVFGTRWIPFEQEIEAEVPAKGYGIHGAPWILNQSRGVLVENRDCIGKYKGDGCVHLALEDMEELFAIIITKPTVVHLVDDFRAAQLPGHESKSSK